MVENSIIETQASAILPLESEEVLKVAGIHKIGGRQFGGFSREYGIISKSENLTIRPNLKRIQETIVSLIRKK